MVGPVLHLLSPMWHGCIMVVQGAVWLLATGLGAWGLWESIQVLMFRELSRLRAQRLVRFMPFRKSLARGWFAACLGFFCVSWVATRSLLFGLLGLVFVPFLQRAYIVWRQRQWEKRVGRSFLASLYALYGLVQAGYSLPIALREISVSMDSGFSRLLFQALLGLERGQTLDLVLARLKQRLGNGVGPLPLILLLTCHREGLSVGNFLKELLPVLQAEQQAQERLGSLRSGVLVQACVAAILPWLMMVVLSFFQPELMGGVFKSGWVWFWIGVFLLWEALGLVCVCVLSRYR